MREKVLDFDPFLARKWPRHIYSKLDSFHKIQTQIPAFWPAGFRSKSLIETLNFCFFWLCKCGRTIIGSWCNSCDYFSPACNSQTLWDGIRILQNSGQKFWYIGIYCLVHVIWTERQMLKFVLNVKYLLLLSFLTARRVFETT